MDYFIVFHDFLNKAKQNIGMGNIFMKGFTSTGSQWLKYVMKGLNYHSSPSKEERPEIRKMALHRILVEVRKADSVQG